jgi:electron transfer flavoprotein alpha subunit
MPAPDILIVVECAGTRLPKTAYELLAAGRHVLMDHDGRIDALLLATPNDERVRELIARGADRVFLAACAEPQAPSAEAMLPAIVDLCRQLAPRLVLLAHDASGAEIAPRLAFRLEGAVATGCIGIEMDAEFVRCTRPCYGGIARELDCYACSPVVATVRAGVFEPAQEQPGRQGEIVALEDANASPARTRRIARKLEVVEGVRLEEARAIVAGGRGLEGPEGFRALEALARELDAAVGASRVPCDLGWCPHSWQIGLTGKTVTPDLYVAVGISGAGHHMAGCGNARTIVAINTDADAAIFQDARFGVVGDYREVVPALAAELRRLKEAQG